ncbi:MAG: NifB/NifX family molybdenum-iron cluster-binding protein [Thermoplasmatota archaeon]
MIIGIPTMGKGGPGSLVGEHFGRAPSYTLIDPETMEMKVIENTSDHMGGIGHPPELLRKAGVDILLCRGLGRKAVQRFCECDIRAFMGANGTVEETLESWRKGMLQEATLENSCGMHAFRSQHQGCHHHHDE